VTRARCARPLGLKTVDDDDVPAWARRPSVGMGKRWDIARDIVACIAPGEDDDVAGRNWIGSRLESHRALPVCDSARCYLALLYE
jgi:hypothetical protein